MLTNASFIEVVEECCQAALSYHVTLVTRHERGIEEQSWKTTNLEQ